MLSLLVAHLQNNGAGVSKCMGVAPGAPPEPSEETSGSSETSLELCCFPYLTGNAVFPACTGNGLGLYHHVDVEHIVRSKSTKSTESRSISSESSADSEDSGVSVVVIDVRAEGLTGELDKEKVRVESSVLPRYFVNSLCLFGTVLLYSVDICRTVLFLLQCWLQCPFSVLASSCFTESYSEHGTSEALLLSNALVYILYTCSTGSVHSPCGYPSA